jgi:ADP-L-glycero-D-manno-heptose 6-epimerase
MSAMNAAKACSKHGVRLIYPSTGLISSGGENMYSLCKRFIESMVQAMDIDALGVRIFAAYGPGEGHKVDYASVPYLFALAAAQNRPIKVFGDGSQNRDFIYIEDVVEALLILAEDCHEKIVDLGSGEQTSFLEIVKELEQLSGSLKIEYANAPADYIEATIADTDTLHKYYVPRTQFSQGLAETVQSIKESNLL